MSPESIESRPSSGPLTERDQQILILNSEIRSDRVSLDRRKNSLLGKLKSSTSMGRKHFRALDSSLYDKHLELAELVRTRPGRYQLEHIELVSEDYGPNPGFQYGFKLQLEGEVFKADFWSYDYWGILVARNNNSNVAELENFDSDDSRNTLFDHHVIYLPEGFLIPVGPFCYENDDIIPENEPEIETAQREALRLAKDAGLKGLPKNPEDVFEVYKRLKKFMPPRHPQRYFFWQPVLPDTPTNIAIDFDAIFDKVRPQDLSLTLEGAPVFSNTKIVTDFP